YHMHRHGVSGSDRRHLRHLLKPLRGPYLSKSDKKVCKYDGPEHQHANVAAEVEGDTDAEHEQHQAQKRFSLCPPAYEQTGPECHQYAGCDRTKDLAEVQYTASNHSAGNGGVDTEFTVIALKAAPLRVVNPNHRL